MTQKIKKLNMYFLIAILFFSFAKEANADGFRVSSNLGLDGCSSLVCEKQGMSVGFGGQLQYRMSNISPGLQVQYLMLPNEKNDSATGMIFGAVFEFLLSEDFFGFRKNTEFNAGVSLGYGIFQNFNSVGRKGYTNSDGKLISYNLKEFSGPTVSPQISIDFFLTDEFGIGFSAKYSLFWVNEACGSAFKDKHSQECVTRKGKGFSIRFAEAYSPSDFPDFYTLGLNLVYQVGRKNKLD